MVSDRKRIVSVIGNALIEEGDDRYVLAKRLGAALIENGYRVASGGLSGVMEAVSKGARLSPAHCDGDVIGILPCWDPDAANRYVDIPIATGMDLARNVIVANTDAVIAIGGGSGTLSEISHAWALGRLIIAYRVEGVSGMFADTRIDKRVRYPEIQDDRVYGVDNENDVLEALVMMDRYNWRHESIITMEKQGRH